MSHCHIKNNYIHINIQAQQTSNLHPSLCSFRYFHLLVLKELLSLYDIIFCLCVIFRGSQIRNREITSYYFLYTFVVVVQLIFTMFKRNKPKKKKKSFIFLFFFPTVNLSSTSYNMLGKPASLGISFSSIKQLLKDLIVKCCFTP